jgi:putative heme iron utilization protein
MTMGGTPAEIARQIICSAKTGALGTLDPDGHPFVTLVSLACGPDGRPILLLSALAAHSRHLGRDGRASLLLTGPDTTPDRLASARLTLVGTVTDQNEPAALACFLKAHPEASGYAGFADFGIRAFTPRSGHLVAGFGKIVTLGVTELSGGAAT